MSYYKKTKSYRKKSGFTKQKKSQTKTPVLSKIDKIVLDANKKINEKVSKQEAQGVAIHSVVSSRTSSGFLADIKDYTDTNLDDRVKVVALARKLRENEGVCSSVADLLVDFAITKGGFYSDNEDFQRLLNNWASFVNSNDKLVSVKGTVFPVPGLRALSRKIFDDYLTDGDCVFSIYWKKGIKMSQQDKETLMLPVSIKTLDTTSLKIDEQLASFGIERITLTLSRELIEKIKKPETEADKFLKNNIPKEWVAFINKNEDIVLDSNVTIHLKRNAKDYKAWGKSLFQKAFTAIANKRRLQAVDEATIDGLINRFTIFKLGLPDNEKNPAYHIPSAARVNALIDILTNPTRVNAAVWPGPDIDVIDIGPDGKVLEFVDKYKQADKDILRALHVSPLLIDGASSGQSSRDWAAFISTEVGLDAFRDELEKVYTALAKEIAFTNNIKYETLYYKFDTQFLKDEQRVRNFALKVFELGGISVETFVKTMGYNFDTEKNLKEKEKASGLQDIFRNEMIPYQGASTADSGPTDKGRPPVPEEDAPAGDTNKGEAKADKEADIALYKKLFDTSFKQMSKSIKDKRRYSGDEVKTLEMSLITGFYMFSGAVASQIKATFYKYFGKRLDTPELLYVLGWSDMHIDSFYSVLREELISAESFDDFDTVLKSQTNRVNMYATESYQKAMLAGKISEAKEKGYVSGRWVTIVDDATCGECLAHDGNIYNLKSFLSLIPVHPRCRCSIEFIK